MDYLVHTLVVKLVRQAVQLPLFLKELLLQFLHLQQDYEYNLELLDGRDAELERYDKDFDAMRQELAAKDDRISELHARLAKAESGLLPLHCHTSDPRTLRMTKLGGITNPEMSSATCFACQHHVAPHDAILSSLRDMSTLVLFQIPG